MVLVFLFFEDGAWYKFMLCYFLLGSKWWNQLLKTCWSNCNGTSMHALLSSSISSQGKFPVLQSLYHLLHGTVSNVKLHYNFSNHHPLVFCYEHINFLLVVYMVILGRSLPSRSEVSLLTSSKHFIQQCTLLAPMQESP
jgi:hypothetical protein